MRASSIAHMIRQDVRCKLAAVGYIMKHGAERQHMMDRWGVHIEVNDRATHMVKWVKPGLLKMNTDGSLKNDAGNWGAAIRDEEGDPVKLVHRMLSYKRWIWLNLMCSSRDLKLQINMGTVS